MAKDYYEVKKIKKPSNKPPQTSYVLKEWHKDTDKKERVRVLELKWQNELSFENSEYKAHFTYKNIFYQRIKKACKIYTSFCLVGTVLIISHGKVVSLYSILTESWMKHFYFNSDVRALYRNGNTGHEVTAFLNDQTIRVIKQAKAGDKGAQPVAVEVPTEVKEGEAPMTKEELANKAAAS